MDAIAAAGTGLACAASSYYYLLGSLERGALSQLLMGEPVLFLP